MNDDKTLVRKAREATGGVMVGASNVFIGFLVACILAEVNDRVPWGLVAGSGAAVIGLLLINLYRGWRFE